MTAGELLALVGAWVVVGLGPGMLIGYGLRRNAGLLRNATLAPLLSLGLLLAIAVLLTMAGQAVNALTVLPAAYVVGALCLLWGYRSSRDDKPPMSIVLRPVEMVVLALIALTVAAVWWRASGGLAAVPPNDDGSNHGLFATQILRLETVQPDRVVVGDVLGGQPSSPYYPLAMHLVAALMAGISGVPVAAALTLEMVLASSFFLPAGTFVLTRRLYPTRRAVASVAALLTVVFAIMPYYVSSWGGFPFIMGMALLPIAIDALAGAGKDCRVLPSGLIAGLILVGLFALHSSEMLAAAGLAVLILVAASLRHERTWREWVWPAVIGGVILVAFVGIQWPQIKSGAGNVSVASLMAPLSARDGLSEALTYLPGIPNPALVSYLPTWLHYLHTLSGFAVVAGVIAGSVISVRRRWSPEWVIALALCLVVTVLSTMRLVDLITVPWYSRWDRVIINELPLVAPLAALGIVMAASVLSQRNVRLALLGGLTAVVALPQLAVSAQVAQTAYVRASRGGADQRAAYAWLSDHVQPGERVLNDAGTGSQWMWALEGVPPLFAVAPHQIHGWGDRKYLLQHAPYVTTDLQARAVADEWNVRWAYVSADPYADHVPMFTVTELITFGGWRVVFKQGGSSVLERR